MSFVDESPGGIFRDNIHFFSKLKSRFPFIYASTNHDTKSLTTSSNQSFERSLSIRCLASQLYFYRKLQLLSSLLIYSLLEFK